MSNMLAPNCFDDMPPDVQIAELKDRIAELERKSAPYADNPWDCYCDNGHEQAGTVCMYCYNKQRIAELEGTVKEQRLVMNDMDTANKRLTAPPHILTLMQQVKELQAKLDAVKEVESYSIELQDIGRPATVMLTKDVLKAIGEQK